MATITFKSGEEYILKLTRLEKRLWRKSAALLSMTEQKLWLMLSGQNCRLFPQTRAGARRRIQSADPRKRKGCAAGNPGHYLHAEGQ